MGTVFHQVIAGWPFQTIISTWKITTEKVSMRFFKNDMKQPMPLVENEQPAFEASFPHWISLYHPNRTYRTGKVQHLKVTGIIDVIAQGSGSVSFTFPLNVILCFVIFNKVKMIWLHTTETTNGNGADQCQISLPLSPNPKIFYISKPTPTHRRLFWAPYPIPRRGSGILTSIGLPHFSPQSFHFLVLLQTCNLWFYGAVPFL